jgi:hypothetical protein
LLRLRPPLYFLKAINLALNVFLDFFSPGEFGVLDFLVLLAPGEADLDRERFL